MSERNAAGEMTLFHEAECKTNRDNLRYLMVLAVMIIFCDFLNEIHIFAVSPIVMRIGAACGAVFFLLPVFMLLRPTLLFCRNTEGMVYHRRQKYLIIIFSWLGTAAACITLTHHTVILMAVPIMIMAQYRNTKKLVPLTLLLSTVCVLLGVYGGYFFGCFDGNLLHIGVTEENINDLALRVELGTMERMIDLFTHYVLPRELVVLALVLLASRISRRSDEMLRQQETLQAAVEQEMQRTNKIQRQIIIGMANLIENRDESTGEHVKRTSYYVRCIVDRLRSDPQYDVSLTDREADTIVRAAPLHDIGKIVVADSILRKPGKLTPEEYDEIKRHSEEGAKVIRNVLDNIEDDDFLAAAVDIAGNHHERFDGNGYPNGLQGRDIPLSARIMAVADVFDALVSKRVYKEPVPPEEAFAIIESESGKQFDPEVVAAFISLKPQILA